MKKETGTVILKLGGVEESWAFDVVKKDKQYGQITLKASDLDNWTYPRTKLSRLINNGEGFTFISYEAGGKKIRTKMHLDYDQAQELRVLLKLEDVDGTKFKYLKD